MAKVREKKGGWGGARPGAGRKKKPPGEKPIPLPRLSLDEIAALVQRTAPIPPASPDIAKLTAALTRLADAQDDIRTLLRRDLLERKQADGFVERPVTPKISRRRPLTG